MKTSAFTYIFAIILMGVFITSLHAFELRYHHSLSGQRRDGSQLWDIFFAIDGIADTDSMQIFLTAFTQSGETLDCYSLTGDYPFAVGSGSFHIIWDIGADVPNREFYSDSIVIKLAAARAGIVPGYCPPHIYIADFGNQRIVRIDNMTGSGWIDYGNYGFGVGEFNAPRGERIQVHYRYAGEHVRRAEENPSALRRRTRANSSGRGNDRRNRRS